MAPRDQKPNATVHVLKHRAVRMWFLAEVAGNKFQPGQKVPSETEMMAIHNVSRATIRRAMSQLEFEGVICRYRGKGTFLLAQPGCRRARRETLRWGCLYRHWRAGSGGVLSGIESLAKRTDAELVVEYVGDDAAAIRSAVERMLGFGVTGLIVEPTPYQSPGIYRSLVEAPVSVVLMRLPVAELDAPVVTFDHGRAGRNATRHLLDLKHRRIGYVSSPRYWVVDQQVEGWREVLEEGGITPQPGWLSFEPTIADDRSLAERGFHATLRLLSLRERPTAIIALNDETAANAYRAIRSRGLRIPDDISVLAIGATGPALAGSMDPPLTVWHDWLAVRKVGEVAAQTLERMCDGLLPPTEKMLLVDAVTVPRGSVSAAPQGPQ